MTNIKRVLLTYTTNINETEQDKLRQTIDKVFTDFGITAAQWVMPNLIESKSDGGSPNELHRRLKEECLNFRNDHNCVLECKYYRFICWA